MFIVQIINQEVVITPAISRVDITSTVCEVGLPNNTSAYVLKDDVCGLLSAAVSNALVTQEAHIEAAKRELLSELLFSQGTPLGEIREVVTKTVNFNRKSAGLFELEAIEKLKNTLANNDVKRLNWLVVNSSRVQWSFDRTNCQIINPLGTHMSGIHSDWRAALDETMVKGEKYDFV